MDITFLLNGEVVRVSDEAPTRKLLDWLRERRRMTGTKEGCNEGDCGACTVMVSSLGDEGPVHQALNACILFLPQLHGKAVRTVEGLAGADGQLHPVQQAMVDHHGSQCGFCTPGIVMSLATAHRNGERNHDDVLAGNLCRCTGYAPIIRAAEAAANVPVPDWFDGDVAALGDMALKKAAEIGSAFVAKTSDELADWYVKNPDATLIGGATDVGLWVTKRLAELPRVALVGQIADLRQIAVDPERITIGAAVNLNRVQDLMAEHHPDFAEMIRRYGSNQVRGAATIGGNIANGSPIGDGPPALIALGATLHLRRGAHRRKVALEDYFVAYGKQDREPGEFVEAVSIPRQKDRLKCYKVSKRFDQDISAVCGCFNVHLKDNIVTDARIAFGGMAATPKRAAAVEQALVGKPWRDSTIHAASEAFSKDFAPISDMRASSSYRLLVARNLLLRYFAETQIGQRFSRVLEVEP